MEPVFLGLTAPSRADRGPWLMIGLAAIFVLTSVGALWLSSTISNKWLAFSGLVVPGAWIAAFLWARRLRSVRIALDDGALHVGQQVMASVREVRLDGDVLVVEAADATWTWGVDDDQLDEAAALVTRIQAALAD